MKHLTVVVIMVVGLPATVEAHHSNPTSRASANGAAWLGSVMGAGTSSLDARLATEIAYFGRLQADDETPPGMGDLVVATLVPTLVAQGDSGTAVVLTQPVGFVRTDPREGAAETSFGLGDLSLTVSQELIGLFGPSKVQPGPLAIRVRLLTVAPTGRYLPEPALSVTGVENTADGALDVVTYDTQASLGAGVWSVGAGLDIDYQLSPRWRVGVLGQVTQPLTTTSDDIRWGRDVDTLVGVTVIPWREVLGLALQVDYRWHDRDDIPEDEGTGRSRVGGRHEVGIAGGFEFRVGENLSCAGRVHVPVFQQVGGVQLVETVSVQTSCGYAFAL